MEIKKLQFDDIHYSIWFLLFESNIQMCLKYYKSIF